MARDVKRKLYIYSVFPLYPPVTTGDPTDSLFQLGPKNESPVTELKYQKCDNKR